MREERLTSVKQSLAIEWLPVLEEDNPFHKQNQVHLYVSVNVDKNIWRVLIHEVLK